MPQANTNYYQYMQKAFTGASFMLIRNSEYEIYAKYKIYANGFTSASFMLICNTEYGMGGV